MTEEEKKAIMRRRIISIACFAVFVAFFVVVFFVVGRPMIQFVSDPAKFRAWVDRSGMLGRLAFLCMTVLQIIVAIIPGEPIEIGAGYAFGILEGTLLCLIGILIGSTVIYLFSKYLGIKAVEAFYPKEKLNSLSFLQNNTKLNSLTFILFFIPGTPKDMLTYFIGLTPMKLHTFLLISVIARFPSVITSTVGGSALGEENYVFSAIVFGVTAILSVAGIFIYRRFTAKHQKRKDDNIHFP